MTNKRANDSDTSAPVSWYINKAVSASVAYEVFIHHSASNATPPSAHPVSSRTGINLIASLMINYILLLSLLPVLVAFRRIFVYFSRALSALFNKRRKFEFTFCTWWERLTKKSRFLVFILILGQNFVSERYLDEAEGRIHQEES